MTRILFEGKAAYEGGRSEMEERTRVARGEGFLEADREWREGRERVSRIACSFWVGSAPTHLPISLASPPPNLFGLDARPSTATRDACGKYLSALPFSTHEQRLFPAHPAPRDMLRIGLFRIRNSSRKIYFLYISLAVFVPFERLDILV
jgi:hypothetical protein